MPHYDRAVTFGVPFSSDPSIGKVLKDYEHLLRSVPGSIILAYHHIPTTGNPMKVPPQRIPGHYSQEVEQLIRDMLDQGIIEKSCSPWLVPAVFVRKKSGDIRLCVGYRELNKKTQKDTYPLPLPDKVQDKLARSKVLIFNVDTGRCL